MKTLVSQFSNAFRAVFVLTLLTGFLYPVAMTGLTQIVRPKALEMSLSFVGQDFKEDRYFHPRPSAIGYQPLPSGGSNLGPTSKNLRTQIETRSNAGATGELLFASGSGLDPHISPDSARRQIDRVAKARGLTENRTKELIALVNGAVEPRTFGFLGQERVNVLGLNQEMNRRGF